MQILVFLGYRIRGSNLTESTGQTSGFPAFLSLSKSTVAINKSIGTCNDLEIVLMPGYMDVVYLKGRNSIATGTVHVDAGKPTRPLKWHDRMPYLTDWIIARITECLSRNF